MKSFGIGDELAHYRCAEDHERLVMYYALHVNGVLAFTRGPELHWWLSGFKVQKAKTSQLSMDIAITFKDNEMREAFLDVLDRSSLSIGGTNTVYFRF